MIKVSASNVKYSLNWVFFCLIMWCMILVFSEVYEQLATLFIHYCHLTFRWQTNYMILPNSNQSRAVIKCHQSIITIRASHGSFFSDHSTQFVFYSRWFFSLILSHETNILLMIKRIYCWNFQLLINDGHKNSINERFYTEKRRRTSLVFLNSWTM